LAVGDDAGRDAPPLGIVVWRPKPAAAGPTAAEAQAALEGAWVSVSDIDGEPWFRCVAANPHADPEWVFERVAAAVEATRA
jgi:L-2,4-diaminobutyrate decarboxylase